MSQIIVGVPGPWPERKDLTEALVRAHGGRYLFAGLVFMDTETQRSCRLDWVGPDERMRLAFELAGQGRIPEAELDAIEAHESTVYLLFDDPGYETVRTAAGFIRALLQAGGLGGKVENSGVAHPRERWMEKGASEDPFDIYALFVQLVGGDEIVYSCGMHNFGLPDAAIPAEAMELEDAAYLVNVFNLYQIAENPSLDDGATFSTDEDAPRFRLSRAPYPDDYDPGEPLYNPHGLWLIRPADDPPAPRSRRWSFRG